VSDVDVSGWSFLGFPAVILDARRTSKPNVEGGGIDMAYVVVEENEPLERALKRFKRQVQREKIMKDIKKSSVYLSPSQKRRLKEAQARKRMRRRQRKQRDNSLL
jgi:small subunit ribosomal protein S21